MPTEDKRTSVLSPVGESARPYLFIGQMFAGFFEHHWNAGSTNQTVGNEWQKQRTAIPC